MRADTGACPATVGGTELDAVRDLAWAGQHERAIEECSRALADVALSQTQRPAWLDLRSASLAARGRLQAATEDAQTMLHMAWQQRQPAAVIRAQNRLAQVLMRQGRFAPALKSAREAVRLAQRHDRALLAKSLLRLGEAQLRSTQTRAAMASAGRAIALYEEVGNRIGLGRAHWLKAFIHSRRSEDARSRAAALRAVDLARDCGDEFGLGNALNVLCITSKDIAERIALSQQAEQAFDRSGDIFGLSLTLGNLSLTYAELGLYRRAFRLGEDFFETLRHSGARQNVAFTFGSMLSWKIALGELDAVTARWPEYEALITDLEEPLTQAHHDLIASELALARGDAIGAEKVLRATLERKRPGLDSDETAGWLALARAFLAQGRPEDALRVSERVAKQHRGQGYGRATQGRSQEIWWRHAQALAANGRDEEAWEALRQAHELLLDAVRNVHDEGLRRSFLNKVEVNREIVRAWLRESEARGLPPGERLAHLGIESILSEPFKRLVDSGTRLNELRSVAALHEFLIEEVAELSGAERVLLVLVDGDGKRGDDEGLRIAGALVPKSESHPEGVTALLQAITPWLEEARRTRLLSLRHGPHGAEPVAQRSCLVAPLIARNALIGFLYADIEGAFGRFGDADRDLLAMLASQAAVALDNAHWAEGLEVKVAERTAELAQALQRQTATAEVMQVVSSSIADAQPVFEKILDGCEALFESTSLMILNLIDDDGMMQLAAIRGRPVDGVLSLAEIDAIVASTRAAYPMPPQGSGTEASMKAGRVVSYADLLHGADVPLVARSLALQAGRNASQMYAPLMQGGRGIGALSLSRAAVGGYNESEQALLKTFADQAVIAIQNARLFRETKDALAKVEERTLELSESLDYQTAISDVLRCISESPTDVAPVFEAILDAASRLFDSQLSAVFRYDGRLVHLVATNGWTEQAIEDARRLYPAPPNPQMMSGRIVMSGEIETEEDTLRDPATTRRRPRAASGAACSAPRCSRTAAQSGRSSSPGQTRETRRNVRSNC